AAIAEGEVVLLGATLVAVAFDQQVVLPVLLQPVGRGGEGRLRRGRERRLVEVEEGVLDVAARLRNPVQLFDVGGKRRRDDLRVGLHEVGVRGDGGGRRLGGGHGRDVRRGVGGLRRRLDLVFARV